MPERVAAPLPGSSSVALTAPYQRFISDLAGMDVHEHLGEPLRAMRKVRDWLANVSRRALPSAERIIRLYGDFAGDLPAIAAEIEFDPVAIPFVDYERMLVGWLLEAPAAE